MNYVASIMLFNPFLSHCYNVRPFLFLSYPYYRLLKAFSLSLPKGLLLCRPKRSLKQQFFSYMNIEDFCFKTFKCHFSTETLRKYNISKRSLMMKNYC